MSATHAEAIMSSEHAETLRRCSSSPDIDGGIFEEERDQRLYRPLLKLGLLSCSVRPWVANDDFEIVHYETTPLGLQMLAAYDRAKARTT